MLRGARWFRRIWRINAVIILVGGALLCVVAIAALYFIVAESTRERHVQNAANLGPEATRGEQFELVRMAALKGTPILMLELASRQRYSMGSHDKTAEAIRNLAFYDSGTATTRWLFPQFGLLLTGITPLAERGEPEGKVRWVLLQVVKKDTNNDERLSLQDLKTVGVADYDGQNYKEIVSEVQRVIGTEFVAADVLAVAFSGASADMLIEIDLPRREVRRRTTLRFHTDNQRNP